ncbi:hypothetical protein LUZ60_003827 [Juncus effusus]|nr:hypothetical protein LUZ60_003827 [Juncus effusus]
MGNSLTKFTPCLAVNTDEEPPYCQASTSAVLSDSLEESIGQSISFTKRECSQNISNDQSTFMPFQTIHCVSVGANMTTSSSTNSFLNELSFTSSSSFDSSSSFSSFVLHPSSSSFSSSNSPSTSGILIRSDSSTILREIQLARIRRYQENQSFFRRVTRAISTRFKKLHKSGSVNVTDTTSTTCQGTADEAKSEAGTVHWAQGKAGEDRVHVVVSEEHGILFVGIYDGFNGPDAPDFLLSNLYPAILRELDDVQWEHQDQQSQRCPVLAAMSRALKWADEMYLNMADTNPELAMMGSCVLVMLMKGEDVYLMSVGDSRAVLAQKAEADLSGVLGRANEDLERFRVDLLRQLEAHERDRLSGLAAAQLTMDHSTDVYQEVRRIRSEHLDDRFPIDNGRVKGSLKVTRAFGAGYLKHPKWNNLLFKKMKVDYVGTSPYISCNPYLRHHKLGPKDRFIILSSDGLYDHFRNDEVVAHVELFTHAYPDADPAHHLVEQILRSAAIKAGKDLNDLINMPQGERRKYYDDVSIVIISLDGRIWRSAM